MSVYRDAEVARETKEEAEVKRIEELLANVPPIPKVVIEADFREAIPALPKLVEKLRQLSEKLFE